MVAVFECLNHINTSDRPVASTLFNYFFSLPAWTTQGRIISVQREKYIVIIRQILRQMRKKLLVIRERYGLQSMFSAVAEDDWLPFQVPAGA